MKKTRHLAILLITFAFITVFSVPTMAATAVCKIGNKSYNSLSAAVKVVKTGQTIKVTSNIKTNEHVEADGKERKFTIDFNNKTYKYTGSEDAFGISPTQTVTIKNLNLSSSGGAFGIGGTLILESGKMTSGYIHVNDDGNTKGTLKIKGGTYQIKKETDNGPWIENNGTVYISKGSFKGVADMRNSGKITISGGTFNYSGDHDYLYNSGKAVITGGSFKSKEIIVKSEGKGVNTTISGGTFTKTEGGPAVDLAGTSKISGGTFNGGVIFQGKATVTGGKSTYRINALKGANVTINKFTVNQGKQPPQGPGHGNPTLVADGGIITVNGGTYISINGYGYAAFNGGQVIFGVKDYKKLFHVKKLKHA